MGKLREINMLHKLLPGDKLSMSNLNTIEELEEEHSKYKRDRDRYTILKNELNTLWIEGYYGADVKTLNTFSLEDVEKAIKSIPPGHPLDKLREMPALDIVHLL